MPLLERWVAETSDRSGLFPHVIALVTSLPDKGEPQYMDIDAEAFNKLSYFQVSTPASAAWDYKLNKNKFADGDALETVLKLTKADTVLLADKTEWKFLRPNKGKRQVLLTAKPPKSQKPEDIVAWLPQVLAWDGVVIDQRGDFLLVGSTAKIVGAGQVQALAVGDSVDKFGLNKDQRKGAGLLSLSENKGGMAIFDIVFLGQGVTTLPTGTKLIIEKKK